jgi:hypothetical protein
MTKLVFLDTEFTDFVDASLISLGMVADSGEEYYVELPYAQQACSAFVRHTVLPLLGREPNAAMPRELARTTLTTWLGQVRSNSEQVLIGIDYQTDWDLFVDLLDYRVPTWCGVRMIRRNINELLRVDFHQKNGLPEHHALYDARAHRYAFRERGVVTYTPRDTDE